jgi:hypothetical protein
MAEREQTLLPHAAIFFFKNKAVFNYAFRQFWRRKCFKLIIKYSLTLCLGGKHSTSLWWTHFQPVTVKVAAVLISNTEIRVSNRVTFGMSEFLLPSTRRRMHKNGGKLVVQESHLSRTSQSGHKCITGESFYGHASPLKCNPRPITFMGEVPPSKWTVALTWFRIVPQIFNKRWYLTLSLHSVQPRNELTQHPLRPETFSSLRWATYAR